MSEATTEAPRRKPFQFRIAHLLIAMAVVAVVIAIAMPVTKYAREAVHLSASELNLKQIGIGFDRIDRR